MQGLPVGPLKVGICGLGTVAQGVLRVLQQNAQGIGQRAGREIEVVAVASRTPRPEVDLGGASFSTDVMALAARDDLDVVVELIGGEDTALALVETALKNGTSVVTGNKAIVARYGARLFSLAAENSVHLGFEAAVAGSIPIVASLTQALAANEHRSLAGIINGTSNFILSAMTGEGQSFADALARAQNLGYAEADPSMDVEGIDAAHKLSILAALAFDAGFCFEDVYVEGITKLTSDDIEYARQLGYCIKHVGLARRRPEGIEARVHPVLIPQDHLLANITGAMNAVLVNSNAAGDTLYAGAGAGELPTASAVVGDLISIAQGRARLPSIGVSEPLPILAIDEIESAYYLRIPSLDQPGAFARVATILSENEISIEAAIQREQAPNQQVPSMQTPGVQTPGVQTPGVQTKAEQDQTTAGEGRWVPIVILTHAVREFAMNEALRRVQDLPEVVGDITRIRVEHLTGAA